MTSASRSYRIRRAGSTVTTALVTVAGLGIVFGAVAWMSVSPAGQREASQGAAIAAAETQSAAALEQAQITGSAGAQPSASDAPAVETALANTTAAGNRTAAGTVGETRTQLVSAEVIPAQKAAAPRTIFAVPRPMVTLRDRVAAHLEAGEFGPALELAQEAVDPAERAVLVELIERARLAVGEGGSAFAAARRVPVPGTNAGEQPPKKMLAGGGANFTELIDLIEQETSGPWINNQGFGGNVTPYSTGVRVDPNGQLHLLTREERTSRLKALGLQARQADLNEDMARPSALRLVSLTRLEREVARRIAAGQPVVETMRHLAGLSRVEYVFVYPEQNEIVIGGPAEGWRYDEEGVAVGASSGRPTLQLDDLVTVLRIFDPSGEKFFQCSIVPRQAHMQRVHDFVSQSQARGPLAPGGVGPFARRIEQLMGEQDVEFTGVPVNSRVAQVILEADYRMKLIGIGKLDGGPRIKSFFDLLTGADAKNPPPTNAMRWWLSMKYDAVRHSAGRDVFSIEGSSVLCQSEDEFVTARGERVHTGQSHPTNREFAANFTQHYAELAERDPVFADLQNIFDLSLVAALVHQEKLAEKARWNLGCFAPEGEYQLATYPVPKTVPTVVNHRIYNGRDIVVQAAGGVRGDLIAVVNDRDVRSAAPQLGAIAPQAKAPELPAGRWWWDAAGR